MSASEPWTRRSASGGGPVGELRRKFPAAVVLTAFRLDDFLGSLRRVRPEVFGETPTPVDLLFYVVLDDDGLGIWSDAHRDGLVTSFAWREIGWVGVDADNFTRRRPRELAQPVIVFDVDLDGTRVPLAFYVMAEGLERLVDRPLDERAMLPLVEHARHHGAGSDKSDSDGASPARWTMSRPTAHGMFWAAGLEAVFVAAACVVWVALRDIVSVPLPAILIPGIGLLAAILGAAGHVGRSEARRGYTTLGGRFTYVDEVDPKTGSVIRRAGDAKLSDEERRLRIAAARSRHAGGPGA